MANIDRIVISCMDRRLNSFLDSAYNNGGTVFVRNAGANIATVINTIKQLSIEFPIKSMVIAPHTDCSEMGLVHSAVYGSTKLSPVVEEALVSQFRKHFFADRKELEHRLNGEIQTAALESFARAIGAKMEVALIDISKLDISEYEGKRLLTITKPTTTQYSSLIKRYRRQPAGMFDSYFIQARGIKDVLPDIEIAIAALHINDVRLISENAQQNSIMAMDMRNLVAQPYMSEAKISLVKHINRKK